MIIGFFQGHTPMIVTSDLDFISEVFIKQYNNFSAKKVKINLKKSKSD